MLYEYFIDENGIYVPDDDNNKTYVVEMGAEDAQWQLHNMIELILQNGRDDKIDEIRETLNLTKLEII